MSPSPPKPCPVCSSPLEKDGICLACLLNEGIEVTDAPPLPARRLGELPCDFADHRLVREIAGGGMGIVFEAEDAKLKRTVALKVIRNAHFARREEAARFRAEMQAVARLVHPHIVPVYESGEEDGTPYFTMRLAEGGSLAERLQKSGAMPERESAAMMVRIARAVQHAHDRGVLHRDLKPANILLDADGGPLLADFGLAKQIEDGSLITRSGLQVGTLQYMSPEQASGGTHEVTMASDVWALGVVLYQMLTNKLPFPGSSAVEVIRRITQDEPPLHSSGRLHAKRKTAEVDKSHTRSLHPDLATLLLSCLEKQPSKRMRSAGFLAEELERFLAGEEIESRPVTGFERLWRHAARNKTVTAAMFTAVLSLVAGIIVSTWQAVRAREAERVAVRQKAESDEIADIVLQTVRGMDEHVTGREVDPDKWREDLLRRMAGFNGDPQRKAAMLADVATMMTKPSDVELFRVVLAQVEPLLDADDPLLWSLRYRLTLKKMLAADAASAEAAAARDELRRILAWQQSHLEPGNAKIYKTQYALAEELIDEVRTPEALKEAEALLSSSIEHYREKNDVFDEITSKIELMTAVFDQGRQAEALKLGRDTAAQATEALGEQHAICGRVLGRLAKHCREAGLIAESEQHARHALDIYWHTVGPDYVKANATLDALADLLDKHSGPEAVLKLRREALKVCDQDLGPLHPNTLRQVAKVMEALRDLHRFDEASETAEIWLDRVSSEGRLPSAAAAIVVSQFQTLTDLDQPGRATAMLSKLPALLQAQTWNESTYFSRWETLAKRLRKAGKPKEAADILRHLSAVLPQAPISERKAAELRPKLDASLRDAGNAATAR